MLELRDITKTFPGVRALDGVSIRFEPGEIHAIVGENGAGKSTLMKIVTGIYRSDGGEMTFNGHPLRPRSYQDSLRAGIDIVHQEIQVVPGASVAENIMLDKLPARAGVIDWRSAYAKARVFMGKVGLDVAPETPIRRLSAAQKQLAQIAKALAANARVLLLDEPTSSLTQHEARRLFAVLRELRAAGRTLVFISHKFEELFELCDRASVLRDGKCVATRQLRDVTTDELVSLMVGRTHTLDALGPFMANDSREVIRAENVVRHGKSAGNSFTLHAGEILGFYGLVGSGRTELARLLIGADRLDSGQIYVDGKPVRIDSVGQALHEHGIAYVTENRKEEGLLLDSAVSTNIAITAWPRLQNAFTRRINSQAESALVGGYVEEMAIRTPSVRQRVGNLSGGNQQKVSLARALAGDCRVLIVDEPTVGVDVGAKDQIHRLIRRLAVEQGRAVIVISSDMPEIIRLAGRILVFKEKRIVGEVRDVAAPGSFSRVSAAIGNLLLHATEPAAAV